MKINTIYNVITTNKLNESVEFYTKHFGFNIVADVGWYKHLAHDEGIELAFMEPDHPTQPPMFKPGWDGKGLILSLQVDDINKAYKEVKAAKLSIHYELTEEEWGQIHFGIFDPNGIPIDIVAHS